MAITRVNSTTQVIASGTNVTVNLGFTVTPGNTLVVLVAARTGTGLVSASSPNATFYLATTAPSTSNSRATILVSSTIDAAFNTLTVTSSVTAVKTVTILEYSSVGNINVVDVQSATGYSASATQLSDQAVTANASDVVIGMVCSSANNGATYASSGPTTVSGTAGTWTSLGNISNSGGGNSIGHAAAEQIVTSTGTYRAQWTSTSFPYVGAVIALKENPGVYLVQTRAVEQVAGGAVVPMLTTTTGNTIIVTFANQLTNQITNPVTSITDSQSNTYTRAVVNLTSGTLDVWVAKNITGGTNPHVTVNVAAQYHGWTGSAIVREYSGLDATSPVDATATNSGNSTAPTVGPTATTAQADELVVAAVSIPLNSVTITAGANYANLYTRNAPNLSVGLENQLVSAIGAQTATFGTNIVWPWGATILTLKKTATAANPQYTVAHTTDANKRKALSRTHSTSANKRKATTKTHTTNAFKKLRTTKAHTTSALKRSRFTKVHLTDAMVRKALTKLHTTSANKKKAARILEFTTSANLYKHYSKTHTTDALLTQRGTLSHTVDANKKKRAVTRTHTTSTVLRATRTKDHSTDAALLLSNVRTHTTSAGIGQSISVDHFTVNFAGAVTVTTSHTTDANRRTSGATVAHSTGTFRRIADTLTHTTDAFLHIQTTAEHTTDAFLRAAPQVTHTTDAVRRSAFTKTHTTDASLRATGVLDHTTDASLLSITAVSHTTSANKKVSGLVRSHSTDANLKTEAVVVSHTTDTLVHDTFTRSHTTSAYIDLNPTGTYVPFIPLSLQIDDDLSRQIGPSRLSYWTTLGRPASPTIGMYGLNTDLDQIDVWTGTQWKATQLQ